MEATTCTKDSDCVHNAKCDSTTGTCQCDDAKNAERDNAGTGCSKLKGERKAGKTNKLNTQYFVVIPDCCLFCCLFVFFGS